MNEIFYFDFNWYNKLFILFFIIDFLYVFYLDFNKDLQIKI